MGLGLSPRQVWLATLINLLLSLGLGGVVLVSNFRTWRAVSSASLVDLHVSLLYITTALAVASIVSGVVGFAGPKELLQIETVYATRELIEIQAPTLDGAVIFVALSGMASSLDALLTWKCYKMGKTIVNEPIPRWKSVLVHIYIWGLNFIFWMMENIPTQIWERNTLWHKKATKGVGIMVGFAFLLLFFALHLTFSFLFIVVFMRSLNHLTEHVHVLDQQKIKDLQLLAVKSIVYACGSLLLYFIEWFLFLRYPRNLQTDVNATPYLLALLVLMELCFIVTRLPFQGMVRRAVEMGGAVVVVAAAAAPQEEAKEEGVVPPLEIGGVSSSQPADPYSRGYITQDIPGSSYAFSMQTSGNQSGSGGGSGFKDSESGPTRATAQAGGGNVPAQATRSPARRRRPPVLGHWRELFSARGRQEDK